MRQTGTQRALVAALLAVFLKTPMTPQLARH